jgi:hypothetical protein
MMVVEYGQELMLDVRSCTPGGGQNVWKKIHAQHLLSMKVCVEARYKAIFNGKQSEEVEPRFLSYNELDPGMT